MRQFQQEWHPSSNRLWAFQHLFGLTLKRITGNLWIVWGEKALSKEEESDEGGGEGE